MPVTVRQLEAIIRISEALAKMALTTTATLEHAELAIELFRKSTMDAVKSGEWKLDSDVCFWQLRTLGVVACTPGCVWVWRSCAKPCYVVQEPSAARAQQTATVCQNTVCGVCNSTHHLAAELPTCLM